MVGNGLKMAFSSAIFFRSLPSYNMIFEVISFVFKTLSTNLLAEIFVFTNDSDTCSIYDKMANFYYWTSTKI